MAMYSNCLRVTGCTTALEKCCWDQLLVPKAMAMLDVSMLHKKSCDKFMGEIFCVHAGILGDAAQPVIGVTTLGSSGVLLVVVVKTFLCELV
jgi:hypothetical protein